MDIKARLEELTQAYVAGDLYELELAQSQRQALAEAQQDGVDLPADGTTLAVGQIIGPPERRMRLVHDLSGKGQLWLAQVADSDVTLENLRAIKIFTPETHQPSTSSGKHEPTRADALGLRAYLAKVQARVDSAMKLDHPNITKTYAWRQDVGAWSFAEMEYVSPQQSQTLRQWLAAQGTADLSWEQITPWLEGIAAALDYARHHYRFAHQHLDSDTVLITKQGTVQLCSFGLASEIREPRSVLFSTAVAHREDGSGEAVTEDTTYRRDVFALALLTYRLLAGRSAQEAQAEPPGAVPRPAGLTDEAWQVLRRGLAYPSELCPTDAGQFVQALQSAQNPTPQQAQRGLPLPQLLGLVGVVGLLIVLGIYLFAGDATTESGLEGAQTGGETIPVNEGTSLGNEESALDREAFEAARRVHTVAAYRLYLGRCPQCAYGKEARSTIKNLETAQKIEELQADATGLLAAFGDGRAERGDEALARLNALAALVPGDPLIAAGHQQLVQGWMKLALTSLNKADTAQARQWLNKVAALQPDLPELAALNEALKVAEAAEQARQADANAFAQARRTDTRKAYWSYLDQCGRECRHRPESEAALARLAPDYPVFRDRLKSGGAAPDMVALPSGELQMGSPSGETGRYSDESQQLVRITRPFAIGKYEVMFQEYDQFANATGKPLPPDQGWGRGRRPVINVSLENAVAYANWLSQQTGQRYRLPTEAEWEYAARSGTTTARYWGDDPNQGCAYANAADLDGKRVYTGWPVMQCHDGQVHTAPAGSYRDNNFGLHDMAGNVLEWTCSIYTRDATAPVHECQQPSGDQDMVVRGGSWSDEPKNVRSAERHRNRGDSSAYFLGFRVVRAQP